VRHVHRVEAAERVARDEDIRARVRFVQPLHLFDNIILDRIPVATDGAYTRAA
jgi:hypothetical protein